MSPFTKQCIQDLDNWFKDSTTLPTPYNATLKWYAVARVQGHPENEIKSAVNELALQMKADYDYVFRDGSHFFHGPLTAKDYLKVCVQYLLKNKALDLMSFHITLPMPFKVRESYGNRPYATFIEEHKNCFEVRGRMVHLVGHQSSPSTTSTTSTTIASNTIVGAPRIAPSPVPTPNVNHQEELTVCCWVQDVAGKHTFRRFAKSDLTRLLHSLSVNPNRSSLIGHRVGAIDLEGDLRKKDIQLIQISFSENIALVMDSASELLEEVLCAAYAYCDVILIHDFHADACAMDAKLLRLFQNLGNKFVDTQLVMEYFTGNPFGGFNAYLEFMQCSELHDDKKLMHRKMQNNPSFWTERPLPEEKLLYAAKDVMLLQKTVPRLSELLAETGNDALLKQLLDATKLRALRSIGLKGKRTMAFSTMDYSMVSAESHVWLTNRDQIDQRMFKSQFQMYCDLKSILDLLPTEFLATYSEDMLIAEYSDKICEFVLDLGQRPYFRQFSTERTCLLDDPQSLVKDEHLRAVESHLCRGFGRDNRAGVDGQLHRISAIKNKSNEVIGLTMRVGRYFSGNTYVLSDLLLHPDYKEQSILVVGPPGSGKTTLIREISRILAEKESLIVVDTSNEICGDGDVTHPCVGMARRMMVRGVDVQHEVMIECVQNHTPTVMVIDEIGRPQEVLAARTCKARGVRIIASAHGDFRGLISNNELRDLVGGVHQVTYGDEEAKRKGCPKVCTERARPPVFDIVIEVQKGKYDVFTVIRDVGKAVDNALQQRPVQAQLRTRCNDGHGTASAHAQTLMFEFINLKE